jgi:hypothetical protein
MMPAYWQYFPIGGEKCEKMILPVTPVEIGVQSMRATLK